MQLILNQSDKGNIVCLQVENKFQKNKNYIVCIYRDKPNSVFSQTQIALVAIQRDGRCYVQTLIINGGCKGPANKDL
jgi:hypothetical protein